MATEEKITKGHCPECGAGKNADIVAEHEFKWSDEENDIWGGTDYRILKCRGCDCVYFQQAEVFSENFDYNGDYQVTYSYWPSPLKRPRPEWLSDLVSVDPNLHSILEEVYKGLDNDLAVLSATGMRTAFDSATEHLGIDPAITFQDKLKALLADGKVGAAEMDSLNVLTDAGSAAAHRGWKPSSRQLSTMMDIVEAFCYRNFILHGKVNKLKPHIPAKQKRRPQNQNRRPAGIE